MSNIIKITACFLPSQKIAIEAAMGIEKLSGTHLRMIALERAGITDTMPAAGLAGADEKTRDRVSQSGLSERWGKNKSTRKRRKNSGLRTKSKK